MPRAGRLPVVRWTALILLIALLGSNVRSWAADIQGPRSMGLTDDGRYLVVALRRKIGIGIIDLESKKPYTMRRITRKDGVRRLPAKIRVYGSTAIVPTDFVEELLIIDVPTARIVRKVPVPVYCMDVIRDEKRSLHYVSCRWQDRILVFDADWNRVDEIAVGRRPSSLAIGPKGRLWVGNQGSFDLSVVDLDERRETARVYLGSRPEDIEATGSAIVVSNHGGAELERLNGVPVIRNDQEDIRNVVTFIDPETHERTERWVDQGADYLGIHVAHGLVAFAGAGSGTVHIHAEADPPEVLTTLDLLLSPRLFGGRKPDGQRVYTHTRDVLIRGPKQVFACNFLRDTIVEIGPTPDGKSWEVVDEIALNATGRPLLAFEHESEPHLKEWQQGDLALITIAGFEGGQKDFSCMTCHSEWHSDFRLTFDDRPDPHAGGRPQGPEKNVSLRFMTRFTPFGWEGELKDLGDFNQSAVTRHGRHGQGFTPSREMAENLARIQHVLTPGPNPYPLRHDVGEALFNGKAGCAGCHPAPNYTDGMFHDVGTGRVVDTPTLVGVWDLVHYLHDARAATIEQVMDPAIYGPGAEPHGRLDALTLEEKADIAIFVRSLGDARSFRCHPGPIPVTVGGASPSEYEDEAHAMRPAGEGGGGDEDD